MTNLLLLIATVALITGDEIWRASAQECTPGETVAEGKIKMECTADGKKPVACLPDGRLEGTSLDPGQTWADDDFNYECRSTGPLSLSYDVVSCRLPGGAELAIGAQAPAPNDGLYKCVRDAVTGEVKKKHKRGCYVDGLLHLVNEEWTSGSTQFTCVHGAGGCHARATGCVTQDGQIVKVDSYTGSGNLFYKCAADGEMATQANLVQVSEEDYKKWEAGNGGDEELVAGGDSAAGYVRPSSAQAIVPLNQGSGAQVDVPTATQMSEATESDEPIIGLSNEGSSSDFDIGKRTRTLKDSRFAIDQGCQDVHPVCKTLCSNTCTAKEAPVGLALRHFPFSFKMDGPTWRPGGWSGGKWFGGKSGHGRGKFSYSSIWGGRPSSAISYQYIRPQYSSTAFQQSSARCAALADSTEELINGLCPRSCGRCGAGDNLDNIAVKLTRSLCSVRASREAPVGLALGRKSKKRRLEEENESSEIQPS